MMKFVFASLPVLVSGISMESAAPVNRSHECFGYGCTTCHLERKLRDSKGWDAPLNRILHSNGQVCQCFSDAMCKFGYLNHLPRVEKEWFSHCLENPTQQGTQEAEFFLAQKEYEKQEIQRRREHRMATDGTY